MTQGSRPMSAVGEAVFAWIVMERAGTAGEARAMLRISRGGHLAENIELSEADLARLIAEAGSALHVRLLRALRLRSESEWQTRRDLAKREKG